MGRHDEPNEYGYAGGATAPEPQPGGKPDEQDLAEEVAVPGDDLTAPATDALADESEERRPADESEERRPAERRR